MLSLNSDNDSNSELWFGFSSSFLSFSSSLVFIDQQRTNPLLIYFLVADRSCTPFARYFKTSQTYSSVAVATASEARQQHILPFNRTISLRVRHFIGKIMAWQFRIFSCHGICCEFWVRIELQPLSSMARVCVCECVVSQLIFVS